MKINYVENKNGKLFSFHRHDFKENADSSDNYIFIDEYQDTSSYVLDIFYDAVKTKKYTCFVKEDTVLPMMYMPDALDAANDLMEADPSKLKHRNCFNITAMSFDPDIIYNSIKKYIPNFKMDYDVDPVKQGIAESWPNKMDDSAAREEWGWNPKWDLDKMTQDMLKVIKEKHDKGLIQ